MGFGKKKRQEREAVGLYLHIPFCRSKCDYCDFYSLAGREDRMDRYQKALVTHLRETAGMAGDFPVDTVYFGGGTPSYYGARRLRALLAEVKKRFQVEKDAEITAEANPDSVDLKGLRMLRRAGFKPACPWGCSRPTRGSWPPSTGPHTPEQTAQAVEAARRAGFDNLSLDLIYGLPGQTEDSWHATVEAALALGPEHLSCYGLKVEEGTPLAARAAAGEKLPDDDTQAELYLWTVDRLARAGYEQYEISNFAKPGFASPGTTCATRLTRPYLGFGPGAHSDFGGRRYSFVRDLDAYIQGVLTGGNIIDKRRPDPPAGAGGRVPDAPPAHRPGSGGVGVPGDLFHGLRPPSRPRLREFAAQGWAERTDEGRWRLTPQGLPGVQPAHRRSAGAAGAGLPPGSAPPGQGALCLRAGRIVRFFASTGQERENFGQAIRLFLQFGCSKVKLVARWT